MRVLIFSFDDLRFPCARLRLLDPLHACGPGMELLFGVIHHADRMEVDLGALSSADVIVVQRGFPRYHTQAICNSILNSGKPVIYEIDDCLPEIPESHGKPHYREYGPYICKFASRARLVTVSTEPLRQYFSRFATTATTLPNYLNAALWADGLASPPPSRRLVRIGYFGNLGHREDIDQIGSILARIHDNFPHVEFVFVGAAPQAMVGRGRTYTYQTDFNYATFPHKLASLSVDIGLAPLRECLFNTCISNLKFLEFGFLGVPGVYADLPPYNRTVRNGENGFLGGADPETWYEMLVRLIENPVFRKKVGRAARETVVREWMLQANAHRWLATYEALVGGDC